MKAQRTLNMKTGKQMQRTNLVRLLAAIGLTGLLAAGNASLAWGAEHPEHPKAPQESAVSPDDVARNVEAYVKKKSKQGTFVFRDSNTAKDQSLTLDKVHRDQLRKVGPDRYSVCADFKGADGHTYDLDFFVQGTTGRNLKVLEKETSVHKVDGKAR
jgi:hypothetical protein